MRQFFYILCAFLFFQCQTFAEEPKLHICTVASHQTQGLDQLLHTCGYFDISIDILGLGQRYLGNSHKLIYVQEYIQNLSETDIVLFVDAYDVLFLTTSEKIKQTFIAMDVPFVISVERFCWPYPNLEKQFPRGPTSFRYINSGSYIGYVYILKEILTEINPKPHKDDQGLMTLHYFKRPELYTFDVYCKLFLPMAGVIPQELIPNLVNKTITCTETGTTPCLIHGNGGSRPMYQEFYEMLFR